MKDYSIYKFAILQILEGKPANQIAALRKELMQKLGISRAWLSKILNARLNSSIKLDYKQLAIIADVLKVKIDALYTKQCRMNIRAEYVSKKSVVVAA